MQANFPTNHNFYCEKPRTETEIKSIFDINATKAKALFEANFELTTKHTALQQLKIFRFKPTKDKLDEDEQLILKLYKRHEDNDKTKEIQYIIQTGLFAGVIYHEGCEFNITCAYGDKFLKRMLNFLNDIYIDTTPTSANQQSTRNTFEQILAYLFVHSLEKSANMGLPKRYQTRASHEHKVRGSVDFNAFLRKDIPFQGKISCSYREQSQIQVIVDVLYLACDKLKKHFGTAYLSPIMNLYQQLKIDYSGKFVTPHDIELAVSHSSLHNPMFSGFRQTLEYAKIILSDWDLKQHQKGELQTYGYLFDISQLFEIYIEKLISHSLPNWSVVAQQQLLLYQDSFYKRHMYPDIVLRYQPEKGDDEHLNENLKEKIIVLDAKFKNMGFKYQDLDRADFYQIHTYMQYYGKDLLFGGLIYPLSKPHDDKAKAHSHSLFGRGDDSAMFIVDGIELDKLMVNGVENNNFDLVQAENKFIERLQAVIDKKFLG